MSKVIVKNVTNGKELLWRSIKIKKSLDEICHSLELEAPASERSKVGRHNRIQVIYENSLVKNLGGTGLVTTVLVDEITATVDDAKHGLQVFGRSPARDIIDSTWSGTCFGLTLRRLTNYIGQKFGIVCDTFPVDQPDPTTEIPSFDWQDESPWTKLIGEADNQGFIVTSNEAGNLYLWKPAEGLRSEGFRVTEGVNAKSIRWTENGSEQFHEYIVTGAGHDPVRVIDDSCPGNRTLTIDLTDPSVQPTSLERRAETEMLRRKETKTIVTVPGWGLTDEQVRSLGTAYEKEIHWIPNSLIPVRVPSLGLNANLLISEVEYNAAADNMFCDLTLVKREAYL